MLEEIETFVLESVIKLGLVIFGVCVTTCVVFDTEVVAPFVSELVLKVVT